MHTNIVLCIKLNVLICIFKEEKVKFAEGKSIHVNLMCSM